jgi:hypothetical protein
VHDEWAPEYEHLHGVLPQQRESDWCERWEAVLERHVAFENYTRSREKPPVFEERIEQYVTLWRNGQELPTLKRRSNGEHS